MIKDLEVAKNNLSNNTISLAKGEIVYCSNLKGILPMVEFIKNGINLENFSVADLIVGKAVALLFVKCKIANVFAKVISKSGLEILNENNIYVEYDKLTENIINRKCTDICPMEKSVMDTKDPSIAYRLICDTLDALNK